MANFHMRSNSFPSQSHPMISSIEDRLQRIRSSEATSASSPDAICLKLTDLRHLQEEINDLLQKSSSIKQQTLSQEHGQNLMSNDLLNDSLVLVDLCGFARDVLSLKKGSVQELQSSMRRNRSESPTLDEMNAYLASEKKINEKIHRVIIKNHLKGLPNMNSSDSDLKGIVSVLREAEKLDASALNQVLLFVAGEKRRPKHRSFSLFSKFTKENRVHSMSEHEQLFSSKLVQALEMSIAELDEGLEALSR